MKKSLNEVKKLQRLAGLHINENLFDGPSTKSVDKSSNTNNNQSTNSSNNQDSSNKIDSVGELAKQFNNVRTILSKGDVNDLSTNEIRQISEILQLLIDVVQQGEVATKLKKAKDFLYNLTKQ